MARQPTGAAFLPIQAKQGRGYLRRPGYQSLARRYLPSFFLMESTTTSLDVALTSNSKPSLL